MITLSVFVISDGKKSYLKHDIVSGKYVTVHNQTLADTFTQRNKAQNVLENSISKKMKKRYKIVELDIDPDDLASKPAKKIISKEELIKSIIEEPIEELDFSELYSNIDRTINFMKNIELRKEKLISEMSIVDKEIEDIKHYIEFNNFNVYTGWLALSMQRQRLNKRRRIQTELRVLLNLDTAGLTKSMLETAKTAIDRVDLKEYNPRALPELFASNNKKESSNGQS